MTKTILVIGTFDTKADELAYLIGRITAQCGKVLAMDVSILGEAKTLVDVTKHQVAAAAGTTIDALTALGEEGEAFAQMSAGAAILTRKLHAEGRVHGMIALGGTMGTDLALDCAQALPLGVPKYIVSTVAGSPLIAAERMAADVQFILWAGGLYGLNPLCKSSLSQAAGAVLGAAQAVEPPKFDRPLIGM
ncbi:MAG: Tm-1-like ATP-binding domain-containing protein, partial [Tabrizicola sp.]